MKRDDLANIIHTSVMNTFEINKDHISYDIKDQMWQTVELSVVATLDALQKLGLVEKIIKEE